MKQTLLVMMMFTCLFTPAAFGCAKETPQDAIQQAKVEQKRAASVNGEWKHVGKFIQQAEKALAQGDKDKAMKLALKAISQAQLGYQQANQKVNTLPSYLK